MIFSSIYFHIPIVTPVTILFKILFQQLCEVGVGWDDPLTDDLLEGWRQLHSSLSGASVIIIPRGYLSCQPESAKLVGLCDVFTKAYATVVYLSEVRT